MTKDITTQIEPYFPLQKENSNISDDDKYRKLKEKQNLIETSIKNIQNSFFHIGKALIEIKTQKLYKADPLYKTWSEYVQKRIAPQLHKSTIIDYVGIAKMQLLNHDFMDENDLIKIGYKKAKLLKNKLSLIEKIKNQETKVELLNRFRDIYHRTFQEFENVPYKTYEQQFKFIQSSRKKGSDNRDIETSTTKCSLKLNPDHKSITISLRQKNIHFTQELVDELAKFLQKNDL